MKHQEYRDAKVKGYQETNALITEHFEALCAVAQELKEGTRIETPYGAYTFIPSRE